MGNNKVYLIVHPDDELFNMRITKGFGSNVGILVTKDECDSKRMKSFDMVSRSLFNSTVKLGLTTGYLLSYDRKLIYNIIKRNIPKNTDTLVLPSTFDTHPEHLLISAIGTRIALDENLDIIYSTCGHKHEATEFVSNIAEGRKYYPDEFKNLYDSYYFNEDYSGYYTLLKKRGISE